MSDTTVTADTLATLDAIIVHVLPELSGRIEATQRLTTDLGIDSMSIVEIVFQLERKLGIEIPDAEMESAETVQDIVDLIDQNRG